MSNKPQPIDTLTVIAPYPAAGKGTLISGLKSLVPASEHIEVGAIVRKHKQQGTALGKQVAEYESNGLLVPGSIIVPHILHTIRRVQSDVLLLLDGFPRTEEQIQPYVDLMQELDRMHHALLVDVPREIAEERMLKRGEAAKRSGKTPRPDDVDPIARKNRLDDAESKMSRVIEHFHGNLSIVDGTQSIEEVQQQTSQILQERGILNREMARVP